MQTCIAACVHYLGIAAALHAHGCREARPGRYRRGRHAPACSGGSVLRAVLVVRTVPAGMELSQRAPLFMSYIITKARLPIITPSSGKNMRQV
jgi:hypothetical protein